MTGMPEDIEMMAEYLGREDPAIRRLLKSYARDSKMAEAVRSSLKRRCVRAGFDPDDPPVFWPVRDVSPGFVSMGRILQGTTCRPEFALPKEVLPQHLGIFGHNGTGKSFLAMHLALGAMRAGLRVWVFDIEDEYSRIVPLAPEGAVTALEPDQLRLNLLEPPGPWVSPASWLGEINLLLRGGTFLRDGSLNLFHTAMAKLLQRKGTAEGGTDWPSLLEVKEYFAGLRFGPKSRNAGFVESLLNRLEMLAEAFAATAAVTGSDMLPALAGRSVIFRLHGMTGIPLQFLTGFLLLWLSRYREGAGRDVPHLVIIEEAHMLSSERARQDIGEGVLCRMFRTARKRRIALVLCDQVPSELPNAILGNLGCRLVMRLLSARCIWAVQSSMGLQRHQAEALAELEPRRTVVQYELQPRAFLIEVPELSYPPAPEPSDLRGRAEALLARARWQEYRPDPAQRRKSPAAARGPGDLAGDALLVMVRICEHPIEPIEQRCQTLRMDRSREFRARAELDERGLVEQVDQTIGGKVKFFRPTEKGVSWAEGHGIRLRKFKSGVVHEYLLSQVERLIGLAGPRWRLQRNSSIARDQGLQPDLLVLGPDGQRAIVEVCCNNLAYDAENILAEAAIPPVDCILAVTPDKRTGRALREALAAHASGAGSASPGKVCVLDASRCLSEDFDWPARLSPSGGARPKADPAEGRH